MHPPAWAITYYIFASLLQCVPATASNAKGSTRCYTSVGTTPTHYKTSWTTHHKPCQTTVTITKYPSSSSSGNVPAVTVHTTSTFTVSASSGFQPVQDTLPGASYDGNYGSDPIQKRKADVADLSKRQTAAIVKFAGREYYARGVSCQRWVQSKCQTITKTVTSSTIPATPTTTITSSTTVYAACATSNFANVYNGAGISGVVPTNIQNFDTQNITNLLTTNANSGYECCVAGFTLPPEPLQNWAYNPSYAVPCYLSYAKFDSTCAAAGQRTALFAVDTGTQSLVTGNGVCGSILPQ